ncbi:hypothetical protein [Bradyrhizobium neotropicale]|uniref:hypothetical protein n=1 Tax=Bradyrhizobium neotropicale TaxID=1497615 RepID=UPI001AD7AD68|nr:hypothetical protein [Bradyrhizobium neotropicale]MBO4228025.1 hypothetical protein [Bradyrhizobium neotropicale]
MPEDTPVQEHFPELHALAKRLGVGPIAPGETVSIALNMADGTSYSLVALVNAFLDRLDAAAA